MGDYKLYTFDEISEAIKKQRKRKPPIYDGPDNLHCSLTASTPNPSWHLSEEGLEYHAERGRNRTDVLFYVMFMLGFHQGVMTENEHTETYKRLVDMLTEMRK